MVKELVKLNTIEKRLVISLGLLSVFLFFMYGYLIDGSVNDIVSRKNVEKEIALLNASLGSLELEYVAIKETIGVEKALNMGFVETEEVVFVEKDSSGAKLTLGNEE